MSIIHNKVKDNFSIVTNSVLRHKGLSWKAKGIYAYLCGCESGFNITQAGLAAFGDCCVESVASGIKELEDIGLVEIEQGNEGRFGNNKWTINSDITDTDFSVNGNSDNGKTASNKSNDNKNNLNNTSPSAQLEEDKDAKRAMEAAYGKKPKRKSPVVKEPVEAPTRPQSFLDLLSVWGIAPIDDKWEYRAWMACLQAGGKPEQILAEAKAHVKKASSPQFIGSLQNWLKIGAWRKPVKQSQTAYTAPKALFPNASQLLLSGATEAHLEALGRSYDDCKRWWASHPSPTRKLLIEKISQEMLKNSVDTAKSQ